MPDIDNNTASPFQLLLAPEKPAVIAGTTHNLRVLVRMQAPEVPQGIAPRHPLHLALVLDRSGSMNGLPLEEAKRCVRNIVDSLAPGDRAAIFSFDDQVECVAPLTPAADKLALVTALAGVESGGTTNLHGGWRAGADELAAKLSAQDVHRVILLSDGFANAGETDLEQIALQCKTLAMNGVTTSTYGIGHHFNEALMLAMATAGRGNGYYGQTAADLAEPFAAEFALLTSLCARGLVLKVHAPASVSVKLRNPYEPVAGKAMTWMLPDLAFASEAWAVLEFEISAGEAAIAGDMLATAITIAIQAATPDSAPIFLMAALPPLPIVDAAQWDAMPSDVLVARRVLELDAAQALDAVRVAIDADDWSRAEQLANAAQQRFARHEWAAAILATMQRLIGARDKRLSAKEAMYASRSLNVRLSSAHEENLGIEAAMSLPRFLRRKPEQGKGES